MRAPAHSLNLVVAFLFCISIGGCASSNSSTQQSTSVENKVTANQHQLTLEDYMRKLTGVQITGSGSNLRVTIRSNRSISNSNEQPLYVLNGQELGNNYSQIHQLVNHSAIISVEAIPPSRASQYGMRGGNGVIVIKTE